MLSRPATASTAPTGTAHAMNPTPITFKECVRLGRSVCSWSSEISGVGPSALAAGGVGSRMVWGAHRPRPQPTTAATPTTYGNGVLKIDNATKAATATATSAGCPKARPATRTTALATITRTAGATAASTAVTIVVSPEETYRADNASRATTPGNTNRTPAISPPITPFSSQPM